MNNFDANALNKLGDDTSALFENMLANFKEIANQCSAMKGLVASGDSELAAKWDNFSTGLSVPQDALSRILNNTIETLKTYIKNTIQNEQQILQEIEKLNSYLDEFASLGSELAGLVGIRILQPKYGIPAPPPIAQPKYGIPAPTSPALVQPLYGIPVRLEEK